MNLVILDHAQVMRTTSEQVPHQRENVGRFPCIVPQHGENASQAAEIVNGVYTADTVTANHIQFWFRRFRSCICDAKDALHTGRPVVENVDKLTEIIEVDQHVSSRSIDQELKIDHKTVLNHLHKVGFPSVQGAFLLRD
ncbi:histone-lysine N-methyltransferase SETMAR [Trichonephila clavipes]|nr:histone-lysine N-methyltransferase SETMAR [Trichonephila clavipes]